MTDFAELHDELRAVARELLGKSAEPGWQVQADAGWLGLEVAEALGGAGATFAEAAVILEERGRAVTTGPWLGTAVLGVGALNLLEPSAGRDELLEAIAAGQRRMAVALPSGDGPTLGFRVDSGRLHGRAEFVPDAPGADEILVVAREGDGHVLVRCRPGITAQPVLDATRSFGVVTPDGIAADEIWRFADEKAVARLRNRTAVAVAADSLGSAQAMLDATVAYAKVRHQFGRPIGSFQAVKHACADMLVQITVARELLLAAVAAVAADPTGMPASPGQDSASVSRRDDATAASEAMGSATGREGGPAEVDGSTAGPAAQAAAPDGFASSAEGEHGRLPGNEIVARATGSAVESAAGGKARLPGSEVVARAKAYVTSTAVEVVGKALQLHGGIGYTWESGIHVHLKRVSLNQGLFGSARSHRRALAEGVRARYSSERSLS